MRIRVSVFLMLAALGLCYTPVAFGGTILLDDFNRPDGTNMGPNWVEQTGDFWITSGRASGTDFAVMTYVGATSNSVTVDVYPGGDLSYVAILLGWADLDNALFLKVQNQDSTAFTHAAFYTGNNNTSGMWGLGFLQLNTPFAAARFTATLLGDTVTLYFDTDFDGTPDQVYSSSGAPIASLGTGIGLGVYGGASMDNFSIEGENGQGPEIPEPGTFVLLGPALLGISVALRRRLRQR
ncbi:MAG: hypothetical protein IT159_04950 [Bryobacterales bacterium]|nr:hypothetical protein [Bryobacterales bacterium]